MAGIQITGLASGLNWQNIVTVLVNADRAPETQWKAQQSTNTSQIASLATLKTDLQAFQTSAQTLSTGTAFSERKATVGNPASGWSAAATPGTTNGIYTVNVSQLASTAVRGGAANVGSALSTSSNVSGVTVGTMNVSTPVTAGIFTVNGAQVTISASDSLQDVFNNISTATGGAVTPTYDPLTDTVKLSSSSPITLGAGNDTSNFLSVFSLYNNGSGTINSARQVGSVSITDTIATSGLKLPVTNVDSSGNGTFSINGVSIPFNVNDDTLQTVIGRINNSGAGVTATYNNADSQFTLTNSSTGDTGIAVSESSGGLLEAMGLNSTATFARGQNAQFTINGSSTFTSASNTLDASVDGINGLTINATSTGTQTVTVGNDSSGVTDAINNMISAYNQLQAYITSQTSITTNSDGTVSTSILSGNQDVANMQTNLQNLMFNTISGMTGGIHSLDSIGIGFSGTSPLLSVQDSTALSNAISNNPDQVASMFNSYPNGLVAQINNFVNNATSSNGIIAVKTNSLTQQNTTITTQIATLERQLAQETQKLTTEFTNMEKAQSQYQNEASTLDTILNGGTASSGSNSSSNSSASKQQSAFANASSSASTS